MANKSLEERFADLERRNAELMEALEAKLTEPTPAAPTGFTPDVLEQILKRTTEAAAGPAQVLASKLKPENADHRLLSPFEHPEGGEKFPKPALAREMWFAGQMLRVGELTYWEVLALNELSKTLSRGQRRVCRDGKWKAFVSEDDQRLTISVPMKTMDDRQDLPIFMQIVQELTSGERAPDVSEMAAELARLKQQMAQLQGAAV